VKPIWFVFAWISFAFGVIGAFMPIIPTTPFLILSAFLFSKSSPRFHAWLLNLPLAGEGIRDWNNNKVIRLKAKLLCTSMILLSLFLIHKNHSINPMIKWPVSLILVGVCVFVATRKSK
jgi:uncharacterized membrane protein YbaN (DUF454 family)